MTISSSIFKRVSVIIIEGVVVFTLKRMVKIILFVEVLVSAIIRIVIIEKGSFS